MGGEEALLRAHAEHYDGGAGASVWTSGELVNEGMYWVALGGAIGISWQGAVNWKTT